MATFIHTADDYLAYLPTVQPLIVQGRGGRQIRVPCVHTIMCCRTLVTPNNYNPNGMPDSKKNDLEESIDLAGFAYPVAVDWDGDLGLFTVIDGFHRWLIAGYDYLGMEYIPIVPLNLTPEQRMMATWTFNKARGFHQVDLDAELIRKLIGQGVNEEEIVKRLGIDLDTLYRYKQVAGIIELFKNTPYSMSWEMKEVD